MNHKESNLIIVLVVLVAVLLFGLFGISFSFATLPLQGIEVQVLVALILFIAYKQISRK
ncbi:hypothetical protein J4416_04760 [Candidatus Pacearchaeota archaeon]|nr:hypothetical protein [Candidatus Pacearchaeota archaeon]